MDRILFILILVALNLPSYCIGYELTIQPLINQSDTVIFDLSQAECTAGIMEFPVYINSDEAVYALDFSMKFDPANMSFITAINLKPYLVTSAWYNFSDSTLRFSSYSMQAVDNNTPLVKLKFSLPSAQINFASFDSVYTLLNGDDCNKKFIDPILPTSIGVIGSPTITPGDSSMLSVNIIPGVNYLWSTGETSPVIFVSSPGIYVVTVASVMGCNSISSIEINAPSPLPVELIMFDAEQSAEGISLSWITATEVFNNYFEIQRTTDNIEWKILGRVAGAGNSNSNIHYEYTDKNPANGVNFYRLKQVDFDGIFKYSSAKKCVYGKSNRGVAIEVYPNPAKSIHDIRFGISAIIENAEAFFKITDQKGVEILNCKIILMESTQTFSADQLRLKTNIHSGLYIATLEVEGIVDSCSFMIY